MVAPSGLRSATAAAAPSGAPAFDCSPVEDAKPDPREAGGSSVSGAPAATAGAVSIRDYDAAEDYAAVLAMCQGVCECPGFCGCPPVAVRVPALPPAPPPFQVSS